MSPRMETSQPVLGHPHSTNIFFLGDVQAKKGWSQGGWLLLRMSYKLFNYSMCWLRQSVKESVDLNIYVMGFFWATWDLRMGTRFEKDVKNLECRFSWTVEKQRWAKSQHPVMHNLCFWYSQLAFFHIFFFFTSSFCWRSRDDLWSDPRAWWGYSDTPTPEHKDHLFSKVRADFGTDYEQCMLSRGHVWCVHIILHCWHALALFQISSAGPMPQSVCCHFNEAKLPTWDRVPSTEGVSPAMNSVFFPPPILILFPDKTGSLTQ